MGKIFEGPQACKSGTVMLFFNEVYYVSKGGEGKREGYPRERERKRKRERERGG